MKKILGLILGVVAAVSCTTEEVVEARYLASAEHTAYLYAIDESGAVAVTDTLVRGAQMDVVVNGKRKVADVEQR